MPSAAQAKGFPLNAQKICPAYFPTRPKFAQLGWGPDIERASPSFLMFQKIPFVSGSYSSGSFYGYYIGQFYKNNWNLLNMPSVLTMLAINVPQLIISLSSLARL